MNTLITNMDQTFPPRQQWVIPSYQRNYVWTERDHWVPLWEDLMALMERVRIGSVDETDIEPHFLGTIITKRSSGFKRGRLINYWWVVDGQQRLTTLQILLAAARAVFKERGLPRHAEMLAGVLANAAAHVGGPGDQYKIRHKKSDTYKGSDYDAFRVIIDSSDSTPDAEASDDYQLGKCYNYFRRAVFARFDSLVEGARSDHATAFNTAVLEKLVVADIRLGQRQNSHAIFEALNARGRPLTEWEKTKNYLLSLAVRKDDADGDRTYQEHFERYDADPYWRGRMDEFLLHFAWIEMPRARSQVPGAEPAKPGPLRANRLYREFRYVGEHLYRGEWNDLKAMLGRLRSYADIHRDIHEGRRADGGGFSPYALKVMGRRDVLRLSLLVPILMILVRRLGRGSEFDNALRVIDSYLMRRIALKARYRSFDVVAFSMVQALRDANPKEVTAVLLERLSSIRGWNWWPRDREVTGHLRGGDMYHGISSRRLRMLLEGVAEEMHRESKTITPRSFPGLDGDESVEHVAPQSWQRHWSHTFNFDGSEEGANRINGLVHRIGNLTLVSYNSRMSNAPWSRKREAIGKDGLELNRRLLVGMRGEEWNETEINRRSIELASYVNKIWPHGEELAGRLGIELTAEDPPQPAEERTKATPASPKKMSLTRVYGKFYPPLVARLREMGLQPTRVRGWRGRWRSFETGHSDPESRWALDVRGGKARVMLWVGHADVYKGLFRHRNAIAANVDGTILWRERDREITLARALVIDLAGPDAELDAARDWMAANLLALRAALQPYLDQIMAGETELDAQEGPAG